ncbi:hypothetical protein [Rhodanobacter sp. DHG33]|uniref:hypothetical protein n=1 Tax=Rhodanobacter sp. DHG33 TaxID=2775921 RepID=UPI00177C8662|nr:hypothetical protein [Rhodanobacter sp. DHG33]MBD8899684.1 hypothetical protein [Rhodanobacter sp. DHG33]
MELKDFVAQTLTQIIEGVVASQKAVATHGATINPLINPMSDSSKHGFISCYEGFAQVVRFDVALTVTEGMGTKGGIGVFAGPVSLGSSGQSNSSNSSVSHVQFNVPLILPNPPPRT